MQVSTFADVARSPLSSCPAPAEGRSACFLRYGLLRSFASLDLFELFVIKVQTGFGVEEALYLHNTAFVNQEHERSDANFIFVHEVFLGSIRRDGQRSPCIGRKF